MIAGLGISHSLDRLLSAAAAESPVHMGIAPMWNGLLVILVAIISELIGSHPEEHAQGQVPHRLEAPHPRGTLNDGRRLRAAASGPNGRD